MAKPNYSFEKRKKELEKKKKKEEKRLKKQNQGNEVSETEAPATEPPPGNEVP
jgi:hypothetical protein